MAKQMLSKRLWWLVVVVALSYVMPSASALAVEPIILGEVTSESGAFAFMLSGHKGVQLAVEEINAAGGVLGRPLQLLTYDDKSKPAEGARLFRELASKNVVAVFGNLPSAPVWAINPLSLELKTPFILSTSYDSALTEKAGHRYLFRMSTSDRVIAYALAEQLAKQPATRYCTVANDYGYGRSITAAVMGRLKALKPAVQVISGCEFWAPMGAVDFTPQITAILGKAPEVLLFAGVIANSSDAFVKQAKAFGLFSKMVGVHPSLGMSVNSHGLQQRDVPEGIVSGSDYPYPPIDNQLNKTFFKAYKARWNEAPWEFSADAYTSVYLVAKAITKAGKVDREALVDTLPGLEITHPVMGNISFRAMDHQSTSGWWFGDLTWDSENSKVALRKPRYVPGTTYLPTEDELRKIRSQ